ncbi:hypothetical protein MMC08_005648 [Hypocenomyce scalaris]|nr:hypothetical protein [Hypocenomyce scalaris]
MRIEGQGAPSSSSSSSGLLLPSFAGISWPSSSTSLPSQGVPAPSPATPNSLASSYHVVTPNSQPTTLTDSVLQDFRLLHYWTVTTSSMFSEQQQFEGLWRDTITKEATSHAFLMHGILAIAAIDLAYSDPIHRLHYTNLAIHHQASAIALFRPMLTGITQENSTAVFAFAGVAAYTGFAMAQVSPTLLSDPITELLEIFKMMRGSNAVKQEASAWLENGSLGPLMRWQRDQKLVPCPPDVAEALRVLGERNQSSIESDIEREVYSLVIENLRSAFEHVGTQTGARAAAFTWPVVVNNLYTTALDRRKPMALAILAHYGVLLHRIREKWWLGSWGRRVVEAASGMLEPEWQSSIRWPKGEVGMDGAST